MNSIEDKYKTLFGAYLGMTLMDEYELKEYRLNEIKKYIEDFIEEYPLDNFNYYDYLKYVDKEESNIVKLQDTLRISKLLNFENDLIYLINKKIKDIKHEQD